MYVVVEDKRCDGGLIIIGIDSDLDSLKEKAIHYRSQRMYYKDSIMIILEFTLGTRLGEGKIIWRSDRILNP